MIRENVSYYIFKDNSNFSSDDLNIIVIKHEFKKIL